MNWLSVVTLLVVLATLGVTIAMFVKNTSESYSVPIYEANAGIGDRQGCGGSTGKCPQLKCDIDYEC